MWKSFHFSSRAYPLAQLTSVIRVTRIPLPRCGAVSAYARTKGEGSQHGCGRFSGHAIITERSEALYPGTSRFTFAREAPRREDIIPVRERGP